MLKHGSAVRPTVYLASLDIQTAFDESKPKHVAQIMDNHNTHGWIIAALLREMSGLSGKAMFECVESSFVTDVCDRRAWKPRACGKRWQPRYWPMWRKNGCCKEGEVLVDIEEGGGGEHQICSFVWV